MHKCDHSGCSELIEDKYKFCYKHRNTRYMSICKIHGSQFFKNGQCEKCAKMKKPTYVLQKKNGKYYKGSAKKALPNGNYLEPYYKRLINKKREYQEQFIGKITSGPGIYGIFVINKRKKNRLGECLYIGQSVDVKTRIQQHKECFKTAQRHINGKRLHNKKLKLSDINNYKVEYKYYKMAFDYKLSDLKFVKIIYIDKSYQQKLSEKEFKELLTFCEQAEMESFNPILNTFAARPSK